MFPLGSAPVNVRHFEPPDATAWDEFVQAHPYGSPFHLMAWKKTIEETYGFLPVYLVASSGDSIRGVLPLFLVRNWLVGSALISSPFAVYGGVLADSPESLKAFGDAVVNMGQSLGVGHVELRNAWPEQSLGFSPVARYVTFTGPIAQGEEAILQSIPRKTRRIVRRSLEQGYSAKIQNDDITVFFNLYSRNLRRLGTPSFPRNYFQALLRNFRHTVDLREVVLGGLPVASVLTFYFRDQVMPYYAGSDERYHDRAPVSFMYFDMMRWGAQRGFQIFDFGRSRIDSGSGSFKSHWGLIERPLPYEILLVKRKSLPNHSPGNPVFRLPIKIWQHTPLPVTKLVGPHLLKLVP